MARRLLRLMLVVLVGTACAACSTSWPWRAPGMGWAASKPPTPVSDNPQNQASAPTPRQGDRWPLPATPPSGSSLPRVPDTTPLPPLGESADRAAGMGPAGAQAGAPPDANSVAGQFVGAGPGNSPVVPASGAAAAPPVDFEEFAPAQTVAIVGSQFILAGDIDGMVNLMLAPALAKMSPQDQERLKDELAAQKKQFFRQQLQSEIQNKLGYLDFMRQVPPDKASDVQKRINESFEKDLEQVRTKFVAAKDEELAELARREPVLLRLAALMKQNQIETLGDLDRTLRRHGSSLEKQQRAYGEHKLMQASVYKNIRQNTEVTHEEILNYYHEHLAEFAIPARARWEQLSVRFDKFPNEQAAFEALAAMGNEVYLGGAPLPAVARRGSQEPNAEEGGQHDWINKGSLASKPLDEALFTLPLNRLSQIIRDDRGLHIIRVQERTEASHTPFLDAQVDIKEKIRVKNRNADVQAYLEKLRKSIRVWTIFDDEPASK